MCCFRLRKTPARIVMALSGLIFLCSIAILVLSINFYKSELFQSKGELQNFSESTFYILMSFSIMAFLVSIGGLISASMPKQIWPVVLFGIILTVICIVFIVFGIALATLSQSSAKDMQEFCENKTRDNPNDSKFRSYISQIDMDIALIVNENMCREDVCPCDSAYAASWDVSEELLRSYRRTSLPDVGEDDGYIPLFFCDGCEGSQQTFAECYQKWESEGYADAKVPGLRQEFDTLGSRTEGIELMSFLEKNFACNGICETGLFYYSLPLDYGIPSETCLGHLKGEIKNNAMYLGIVILITGIISTVTWFF